MFSKLKSLFKKKDDDIVAIVTIEREPRRITRDRIKNMLDTLGVIAEVTEEQPSYIRVISQGWNYVIYSLPVPYKPFKNTKFDEERMRQVVADHTSYFVAECMECPTNQDRRDSRPLLAKLSALLIDDQSLAIYDWTTARYAVLDQKIIDYLTEGDPDGAVLGHANLYRAVRDEEMEKAISEAQRRWPEFCAAYAKKEPEQKFIVKGAFRWNDHVEHMWISPTAAHPNRAEGTLRNVPVNLPKPRCGDAVTIALQDISDWHFTTETGETVGDFTKAALQDQKL